MALLESMLAEAWTWQNLLVRLSIAVSIGGVVFIIAVIMIIVTQNTGGDSVAITAAIVLILCAVGTVQLLVAGAFFERHLVAERLPEVTPGRLLLGLLISGVFFEVKGFVFGLSVASLCVCGVYLSEKPVVHLRGIAVCDALVCLGLAEVVRRSCGWDEGGNSRTVMIIYALMGTFNSGLLLLTSVFRLPKVTKLLFCLFALAALHAITITLNGVETVLRRGLANETVNYDTDYCIRSDIKSPVGYGVQAFKDWQREEPYVNESLEATERLTTLPPPDPCAGYGVVEYLWPKPSDAGGWAIIILGAGGTYLVLLMLAKLMFFTSGVKVSPEVDVQGTGKKMKRPKSFKKLKKQLSRQMSASLNKEAAKSAWKAQKARLKSCCSFILSSTTRVVALLVLIGLGGGLAILYMRFVLGTLSRRLAVTTAVPGHISAQDALADEVATQYLAITNDMAATSDTNTTMESGLTPMKFTDISFGVARILTDTGSNDTFDATDGDNETVTTTTTTNTTTTITTVTTTTTTTTSTTTTLNETAAAIAEMEKIARCGPPEVEFRYRKRPKPVGVIKVLPVADRIGILWCQYGEWAAVGCGAFAYACHLLACAIAWQRATTYSAEDKMATYRRKMRAERARTKSKDSGSSFSTPSEQMQVEGFHLVLMQPKDPFPEATGSDLDGRIFDV